MPAADRPSNNGSQGDTQFRAIAEDAAGNIGYQVISYTVTVKDTERPVVQVLPSQDKVVEGDTVQFTVTATDNVGVTSLVVTVNGEIQILDANGQFSYTFAAAGSYIVRAEARDAAGNIGFEERYITVTEPADTERPVVQVLPSQDKVVAGDTVKFTVTATDNVGVTGLVVTVNGEVQTLDANGQFSYTFAAAGTYIVRAEAIDAAGNIGFEERYITVTAKPDTIAPVVNVTHNGGSTIYQHETIQFTVTATDNVGVVGMTLTINGKEVALDANGQANYTFTATGTYTIVATAVDAAGNVGTSKKITVTVKKDCIRPVINSITHNSGSTVSVGQTVEFTVTASDNVMVSKMALYINGVEVQLDANGKGSYTFAKAGTYTITAKAWDPSGNVGCKTICLCVKAVKDTVKPVVSVTHNAADLILTGQRVVFSLTATDNIGVTRTELTINGKAVTLDADGKVTYAFSSTGTYTIVGSAWDAAGNKGTATITVKVVAKDTEAPQLTIRHDAGSIVYAGQTVNFTVTATDNVGVTSLTMKINNQDVNLENGKLAYTFTEPGLYTIEAIGRDAAGNIGIQIIILEIL